MRVHRPCPPVACLLLCACAISSGHAGDESQGSSASADTAVTRTLSIDASRLGFRVPATYVGLAISRSNISGFNGYERIFENTYPHHDHLVNLLEAMGVRHARVVSDGALEDESSTCVWVVDPTREQDDAFFESLSAAGLGEGSVIYSLHLFNEESAPAESSDVAAAQHLWPSHHGMIESLAFDNEPDWLGRYGGRCSDPAIRHYLPTVDSPGYREEWTKRHDAVLNALGDSLPPPHFSGPDTGSSTLDTAIDGVPFTLRFAIDQRSRIDLATQHYYGGNDGEAPAWTPGSYYTGDVVRDPSDGDLYDCIEDDPQSTRAPHSAPTYWSRHAAGHFLISARQMAQIMLDPARHDDWQKLLDRALAGAKGWPSNLHFRLTESNAFSGGQNPGSQILATALWSLDYFHWWAARGCQGIDPFTRAAQYNSPIYQDSTTHDFVAEPYAYGMLAFGQGSDGTTVDPSAIAFDEADDRVTAYAVVNPSHLFVTIVNKTFRTVGAEDMTLTVGTKGFEPKHARALVLESASGSSGDATSNTVVLGQAEIRGDTGWKGTWGDVPVAADGSAGPLTIRAASAVVLDLSQ